MTKEDIYWVKVFFYQVGSNKKSLIITKKLQHIDKLL
jgi:hypothetical protein